MNEITFDKTDYESEKEMWEDIRLSNKNFDALAKKELIWEDNE